jgi:O-antigen/teichoic acid export membrane protein
MRQQIFNNFRKLLNRCGFDQAVVFTLLGRAWSALAGVLTLILVTRYLSLTEQGFYYTFASLLAMQVIFELGMTYVIMQIASHERARLYLSEKGLLEGDPLARLRLASLLRLGTRWYGVLAGIFLITLVPAGLLFFNNYMQKSVVPGWQVAWIWTVLAAAGNLFVSPVLAFLEGCGFLTEVVKMRTFQAIVATAMLWVALVMHLGLNAAGVFATVNLLVSVGWVLSKYRVLLVDLLFTPMVSQGLNWWREIWPFQWRIALSWLSGYFANQLFIPVLFAFYGPAEAGRLGMSITMMGTVSSVALAWVYTKGPTFGKYASLGQVDHLDALFFRSFKQAILVSGLGAVLVLCIVLFLNHLHSPFASRILAPLPFALLVAATFVNVIWSAEAMYLRAFKQEPFLSVSLLTGFLVCVLNYLLGRAYGASGMMLGYLAVNLVVGLGLGTWVFNNKRLLWRKEIIACS